MVSRFRSRHFVLALFVLAAVGCGGDQLTLPSDEGDGGGTTGGTAPATPPASTPEPLPPPDTPVPSAARIEPLEGLSQVAVTGQDVTVSPAVRVLDSLGQPVAGYPVTFVVTAGGGTLLNPSQSTDSDGIARVARWTLGSPGSNTVEARADALSGSPVLFQATALSRADVDHFVFVTQPDGVQIGEIQTVQVALVDALGNVVPLSGIEMYLGLFRREEDQQYSVRNDLLSGARFADTNDGVATFHLGVSKAGTYQFRALSDELPELGPHGPEPFLFSSPFNVY
jgi:hypothetical protein